MSAINPIPTAPNTNPKSLQNLQTPRDVALHLGCAISLIAASSVGYTRAVFVELERDRVSDLYKRKRSKDQLCHENKQESGVYSALFIRVFAFM